MSLHLHLNWHLYVWHRQMHEIRCEAHDFHGYFVYNELYCYGYSIAPCHSSALHLNEYVFDPMFDFSGPYHEANGRIFSSYSSLLLVINWTLKTMDRPSPLSQCSRILANNSTASRLQATNTFPTASILCICNDTWMNQYQFKWMLVWCCYDSANWPNILANTSLNAINRQTIDDRIQF